MLYLMMIHLSDTHIIMHLLMILIEIISSVRYYIFYVVLDDDTLK